MRNRKFNLFITIILAVSLIVTSFSVAMAKPTAASKMKDAKEAAKKAAAATAKFEEASKKMHELQDEIEATQAKIKKTEKNIEKKKEEINQQEEDLGDRLVAMYKTGNVGYVDVILSSEGIAELISNLNMVQIILESDQDMLRGLEKEHKKLKKLEKELEDQEVQLEADKEYTAELKKKFQKEADEWKKKEEQLLAESQALAAEAAANGGAAEELIKRNGGKINTKNYAWPTTTSSISDGYGWRICPFHGREFHDGLDITASTGCPIYAIADAMVTRAEWYGGYGNCVVITCGNGISALYGHLSKISCRAGQFVTRGTILGYTGSTGNSTGPHLHFTVFKNGSAINPYSLY